MATLHIEKVGGLAGFGGARSHLRSRGQIDMEALSPADRRDVEILFQGGSANDLPRAADEFTFRISRTTAAGTETVEAPESRVPAALASCVKDELV